MERQEALRSDDDDSDWSTVDEDSDAKTNDGYLGSDDELDPDILELRNGTTNVRVMRPKTTKAKANKHCLYLTQGAGGIYTFPTRSRNPYSLNAQDTTTICMTGCITCVGVYIPIDDKRCFAAHLDGSIDIPLPTDRNINTWQIPNNLVQLFKNAIRTCLDRTFQGMEKEVESVREHEDLKNKVIIVCPWQVVGGQKGPGFHIIDVLCDYFQLDRSKVVNKHIAHGFIVDHFNNSPGNVKFLGWTRPGPTERELDEMAKIAMHGGKPTFGENFRSVFRATYEYVMHFSLGWKWGLSKDQGKDAPWTISYDYEKGAWCRG